MKLKPKESIDDTNLKMDKMLEEIRELKENQSQQLTKRRDTEESKRKGESQNSKTDDNSKSPLNIKAQDNIPEEVKQLGLPLKIANSIINNKILIIIVTSLIATIFSILAYYVIQNQQSVFLKHIERLDAMGENEQILMWKEWD